MEERQNNCLECDYSQKRNTNFLMIYNNFFQKIIIIATKLIKIVPSPTED